MGFRVLWLFRVMDVVVNWRLVSVLQEISIAANVPQKEIGKYIKILGEALQLSQPINSNSISVHMPRFCTLLQLNKSAQVPFVSMLNSLLGLLIEFTSLEMSLLDAYAFLLYG